MASADYYLCDRCDRKTFYDGWLHYGEHQEDVAINPDTGIRGPMETWGLWLCCAKNAPRLMRLR